VDATTGWSSKAILEEFITGKFQPVKDSKEQLTVFELKPTGAIEAVKKRENKKGHFISVLRGFGTTNQMRLLLEKINLKFTYPKPINLIAYLVEAFSSNGDIILDSFAGSGTTANAVLHLNKTKKTNRKFILIELENKNTFEVIVPRLKAVINGDTRADLTPHGGGFKFYTLAPSLLNKDKFDNWVISKEYNATMLAAALAKQEGFTYQPNEQIFWKQGFSTANDYIFTTTQYLTYAVLASIAEELLEDESLLICCTQYEPGVENAYPNINLHKIPSLLLSRCEFGKDDYSLNIVNSPLDRAEEESVDVDEKEDLPTSKPTQPDLFTEDKKLNVR
jgi:adenine-specific DNA-methyltransferase